MRPTRSWPPSAFRTCCRTCSARARCRRRSFLSTPRCSRAASGARPTAWRAPSPRCSRWSSATLVLVGVLATPLLIDVIAPGFHGEKRALTIAIVRILFPGAGLLVMSAWCLGILNSHHRFLLSYAAASCGTSAMIGDAGRVRPAHGAASPGRAAGVGIGRRQRAAVRSSSCRLSCASRPICASRSTPRRNTCGPSRAISCRRSSAAASCRSARTSTRCSRACCRPARSPAWRTRSCCTRCRSASSACRSRPRNCPRCRASSGPIPTSTDALRRRLDAGLRQIAFFVVPSAMAFLALGDVVAAAVLQTGRFRREDAVYVWGILAGSAVGLLASTLGPLVFVHLLRAPRYAHAAAVRHCPRGADDGARLPVRDSAAAVARRAAGMGRRRADRVGRASPGGSRCCCCAPR